MKSLLTCGITDPSLIHQYAGAPVPTSVTGGEQIEFQQHHMYPPPQSPTPSNYSAQSSRPIKRSQSPYLNLYQTYPYPQRRPSLMSHASYGSQDGSFESDENREKGRCPNLECGKLFKDLKAHMLTHQNEKKCPIATCDYHIKGFAREYDKNRHTLTHYKGAMVCGFCPGSGSSAEKSFNRADVFKRHLTSVHAVEQTPPNSRKKIFGGVNAGKKLAGYAPDATGKCSACSVMFQNAQEFYEHLDDCVLRIVQQEDPSEAINAQRLAEVENDPAVHETLGGRPNQPAPPAAPFNQQNLPNQFVNGAQTGQQQQQQQQQQQSQMMAPQQQMMIRQRMAQMLGQQGRALNLPSGIIPNEQQAINQIDHLVVPESLLTTNPILRQAPPEVKRWGELNLTSPSMYNESPDYDPYETSPMFHNTDLDPAISDPLLPLFPDDNAVEPSPVDQSPLQPSEELRNNQHRRLTPQQFQQFQGQNQAGQTKALQNYTTGLAQHQQSQMPNNKGMPNPGGPQGQGSSLMTQGQDGSQIATYYNAVEMSAYGMRPSTGGQPNSGGNHALQDYQMQLMLLEQQNKKRLMMARQEQDSMGDMPRDGPGPNGQPFQGASPQGGRTGTSPNLNDPMKRGTPQLNAAGIPSPLSEGQGRGSPGAMNVMPGQMYPTMAPHYCKMIGMEGNMVGTMPNGIRPPSLYPANFNGQMNQQMNMTRVQQQQQQGGVVAGPGWQPGPNGAPMIQQTSQGPVPRGMGTPQQRAMPPPSAPTAGAPANGRTQPSSPQSAAPPTPSQANKAAPKAKKDAKQKVNFMVFKCMFCGDVDINIRGIRRSRRQPPAPLQVLLMSQQHRLQQLQLLRSTLKALTKMVRMAVDRTQLMNSQLLLRFQHLLLPLHNQTPRKMHSILMIIPWYVFGPSNKEIAS
jgi:hypothetical protein